MAVYPAPGLTVPRPCRYAVLAISVFRDNDPVHFPNLETTLLTLFRMSTFEVRTCTILYDMEALTVDQLEYVHTSTR